MKQIRVALVGRFGHYVEPFAEWEHLEGLRLTALAPGYPDEPGEAALPPGMAAQKPTHYEDYRSLLEADHPDILVVSTRLDRIPEIVETGAQAGCHIVAEKPLALDLPTLDRLERAVTKAGVKLICMLSMRNDPVFLKAREIWRSGRLGKLILANARKTYKWGVQRPEWFGERNRYGGTLPWVGIHAFDMIHYATGLPFETAAGMHANLAHPERPDCEDHAVAMGRLAGGAHYSISVDYHRPDAAEGHGDDWLRLVGDRGELRAAANDSDCRVLDADGEQRISAPNRLQLYRRFVESLREGVELEELTTADCFHLCRACLAARDSADAGGAPRPV